MKDSIKRGIVIAIFSTFLIYLVYLLIQGTHIVKPGYENRNTPAYVVFIAICVYMVFLYGIYPIHIKFSRATSLFIALLFIVISVYLENDGEKGIIIGDLFSVLGVATLILFPTNILTTDKVKKQKAKKNEVIIEV